ncbi:MAG: hypothetical protein ACLUSP_11230 [Christensenellales bacterium]
MRGLLGGTVIVSDLDTAVALARRRLCVQDRYARRRRHQPVGLDNGRQQENDIANIFSHERELKELDELVAKLSANSKRSIGCKDKCAEELDEVQNGIKEAQQEVHLADVDIAAKSETRNKLRADAEEKERTFAELSADLDRDKARAGEIDADIDSVSELEALITSKKQTATEDDESVRHAYDELKAERDSIQEKLTAARVTETEADNAVKSIDTEIERLIAETVTFAGKIDANAEQIGENEAQIKTIESSMSSEERRDRVEDERRIKRFVRNSITSTITNPNFRTQSLPSIKIVSTL